MTLSLHAAVVPPMRQMLGAMLQLVDKAEAWCMQTGAHPDSVIEARLHPTMLPFWFQMKSMREHSAAAMDAVLTGHFTLDADREGRDFAEIRAMLSGADAALASVDPAAIEARQGQAVLFQIRETRWPFVAEDFLFSFALPNFYFHATTAYDILRHKGLRIGKVDFLGRPSIKS